MPLATPPLLTTDFPIANQKVAINEETIHIRHTISRIDPWYPIRMRLIPLSWFCFGLQFCSVGQGSVIPMAYRPHSIPFFGAAVADNVRRFLASFDFILFFINYFHFFYSSAYRFISKLCIGVQIAGTLSLSLSFSLCISRSIILVYSLICRVKSILKRRHTRRLELTTNYSCLDKVSGNWLTQAIAKVCGLLIRNNQILLSSILFLFFKLIYFIFFLIF